MPKVCLTATGSFMPSKIGKRCQKGYLTMLTNFVYLGSSKVFDTVQWLYKYSQVKICLQIHRS